MPFFLLSIQLLLSTMMPHNLNKTTLNLGSTLHFIANSCLESKARSKSFLHLRFPLSTHLINQTNLIPNTQLHPPIPLPISFKLKHTPNNTITYNLQKKNLRQTPLPHKPTMPLILLLLLFSISTAGAAATSRCSTPITTAATAANPYKKCLSLPTQEATFSWTYHPSNSTLDAIFSGSFLSPSGWVAWGINPLSPQMTGTHSVVTFSDPSSGTLLALPFLLDPSVKLQSSPLVSRPLNHVTNPRLLSSSASLHNSPSPHTGAHVRIHAIFKLNPNQTKINLVWNRGLYVQGYSPTIHPTSPSDLSSRAVVDLLSSSATIKPPLPAVLRSIHAILNSLSWGFCLPVGVLTARYLRHFPNVGPTWFYAHAAIQIPGFFIGVAGFIIGIIMGADSVGVTYGVHRGLGIAAVCMGGLQAAALMFRPGTTNRYRKYWKSYHHLVGYGCVVVGVVNVFQGFEVMGIGRSYAKLAYCLVLSTVVGACVALEANAWVVFCRKAEEEKVLRREEGSDGMLSKGNGGLI